MVQPEHDRAAPPSPAHVAATKFIDADDPRVRAFAQRASNGATGTHQRIGRVFEAVRDQIRYDPYSVSADPEDYVAGNVIERGAAYCVPKAVVLAAAARSLGIPARLGFSDVRNHLQSERLAALMGSDIFVFHGYTELYVGGAWRKATPAFNAELCERFEVAPLSFDGSEDALLHQFTGDGSRHIEYIRDRGAYADLPLKLILDTFESTYPALVRRAASVSDPAFAPRPRA